MRLLLALLSVRATQPWAVRRRATPVTPRRATRDAAPAAPREAVGARAPPAPAKPPKIGECNEHLRRRAKARDAAGLRREWRALRRHHEPNDRSWGILLDGLARVGDADACLATLRAVPGGGNVVHHPIVVDALARAGRGDDALSLYAAAAFKENARSRHARLRALTQAARDATLAGDVERARGHSRTAEAVAAVPGKVFDAGAGAIAWLQSVLPKGPPQLRPPPDQLRSAQPTQKKKWGRPMELPKEEPVAAPPKASPIIDVEAYVPAAASEEDWERMEAKERESSKKPAPTSYLDGL